MKTLKNLIEEIKSSEFPSIQKIYMVAQVAKACKQMAKEIMPTKGIIGKDNKMYVGREQLQQNITKFINN